VSLLEIAPVVEIVRASRTGVTGGDEDFATAGRAVAGAVGVAAGTVAVAGAGAGAVASSACIKGCSALTERVWSVGVGAGLTGPLSSIMVAGVAVGSFGTIVEDV